MTGLTGALFLETLDRFKDHYDEFEYWKEADLCVKQFPANGGCDTPRRNLDGSERGELGTCAVLGSEFQRHPAAGRDAERAGCAPAGLIGTRLTSADDLGEHWRGSRRVRRLIPPSSSLIAPKAS
jgi:hypothetical protein